MISNHKLVKVVILASAIIFFLSVFTFAKIVQEERSLEGKIYPNVIVNNINFGREQKSEVEKYFENLNSNFHKISIIVFYQNDPVATFSGTQLGLGYDAKGIADRAYLIGRSSNLTSRVYQKISSVLNWQKYKFSIGVDYDRTPVHEFILDFKEKYDKPAKNALFNFENGRVVSFRQEESGQEIEKTKFLSDFDGIISNLEKRVEDRTISLSLQTIQPEITLAKANDFGIEELIAEGKSDFSHSIPGRIHNIVLAASKFNGILIPKGKVFSFNEAVGDISSLTGYQLAYIIKSGKTVLGDGGGVCQVSTTLFRAALNAGLPIVERTAHAYRVGYYENDSKPGFDATVYAPSPDLKIKNDTLASILVQTEVDQDKSLLFFRFYGKKDARKVEISQVTVYDATPPLPEIRQDDPTLKKGVVRQVDFPAWGAKAVFDYKVTNNNQTTFEKKFLSVYRPWQSVYLVGTAE
ncbi:VanW family protein [Candidatus Roizmanbacteria bacterium]|nr:VanW family protein [Candidatus Roizmanbacteria bacterium]